MRRSNLSWFTDCTKDASAAAPIHYTLLAFYTNKTKQHHRNKPTVALTSMYIGPWGKVKRCLQFRRNSNLQCNNFFTFSVARSSKACSKKLQEEKNFEVLKRCYIQIYPTSFLLFQGKAVNLLHIWNLQWNNVKFS